MMAVKLTAQTGQINFETFTERVNSGKYIAPGTYIYDSNNMLDKFEGTYSAEYGDFTFEITLTKYVNQKTPSSFFEDFITFQYTILNKVTKESYSNFDESVYYVMKSTYYPNDNAIVFNYLDEYSGLNGIIMISVNSDESIYSMHAGYFGNIFTEGEEIIEPSIPNDVSILLRKENTN